jgi:N-acetyl-gamma-glutamyl-phosphate reductase
VSGAGRDSHAYSEVNESTSAYKVEGHQHLPEITQELTNLNNSVKPNLTFVPHLVPMTRGILTTCYAPLNISTLSSGIDVKSQIRDIYNDFYSDKHFVQIADEYPMTKHTLGSNNCVIYPTLDIRSNRLVVISCIDNLVKGAAGQAVQNMNLMFGLPEVAGLQNLALYP